MKLSAHTETTISFLLFGLLKWYILFIDFLTLNYSISELGLT